MVHGAAAGSRIFLHAPVGAEPELIELRVNDSISTGDIRMRDPSCDALMQGISAIFATPMSQCPKDSNRTTLLDIYPSLAYAC